MGEYQSTVDSVRSFAASPFQVKTEELVTLAGEFARQQREANDRLRRCGEYLQKGLRAEAIHEAEATPNLLDLVAALDIPELEQWRDICFRLELQEPPGLLIDVAAALNEAYAQEQPLEGLMGHHRLLALARAPLKNRLVVMRRIAVLDPGSLFWDDDIRHFERTRLDQIRAEIPQYARARNAAAVRGIQAELSDSEWRTAIPPELSRSVDQISHQLQSDVAERELRELLPALDAAYSAMSFEECRRLVGQWLAIATQAKLTVPAELQERIAPIQKWVLEQQEKRAREQAFEQACASLRQTIDSRAPQAQFQAAYRAARTFQIDLPEELEKGCRVRAEQLAAAAKRRRRMAYLATAAALLVCAVLVAAIAYQKVRARQIDELANVIEGAKEEINQGNVDHGLSIAKRAVDEHPRLAGSPLIVRALAGLKNAASMERARSKEFNQHFARARSAGPDHPDLTELTRAESLAKTPDEKRATSALRTQIDAINGARQAGIDDAFMKESRTVANQIDEQLTGTRLPGDIDGYRTALDALREKVGQLASRRDVSGPIHDGQVAALNARLEERQAVLEAASEQQQLLHRVAYAKSVDEHASALRAYIAKLPSSPRALQFTRAADSTPAEHAVEDWGRIVGPWSDQMSPGTAREAAARIEQVQKYLKDHPQVSFAKDLSDYVAYLNAGMKAVAADGPWKKSFRDLLLNPLVHDLKTYETSDSHLRYYVRDNPNLAPPEKVNGQVTGESFEAVISSNLSKPGKIHLKAPDLLVSTTPAKSPQSEYAGTMLARLDALDFNDWDTFAVQAVDGLQRSQQMDIVLKAILLENVLRLGQPTFDGTDAGAACKHVVDGLIAQNVEDIEWMNPENPPRDSVKEDIQRLVKQIPDAKKLATEIEKRRDAVFARVPQASAIAGILLKDDVTWKILGAPGAPVGPIAYAVGPSGKLVEVAQHQGDQWKIDAATAQTVTEGSLVFVAPSGK